MSNKTFIMSTDKGQSTVPVPHRGLQLDLLPDGSYSNSSMSPSPDSESSISNMSDREADGSPDINMLQCCLTEGSYGNNQDNNNTSPKDIVFSDVSAYFNQTFMATPVGGCIHFVNNNLSMMSSQEMVSEKCHAFSLNAADACNSSVTTPDSTGMESHLSSCETSRRSSTENDWHSLSSGEMLMRRSSFCLEDQSLPIFSSLEESSISPAAGPAALPAESNHLSTNPLDVREKSSEKVIDENIGHPCLGVTFTQAEHLDSPSEQNDMGAHSSPLALPSENDPGLFMTFVCEPSSLGSGKEAHFDIVEAEVLADFPGANTPEQGKLFVSSMSAMQETDKGVKMSTPVQNIENKIHNLPSLSEFPGNENACSPVLHPVKQQHKKQPLFAGWPPSARKVKKLETKKFPKSDLSSVKSKSTTSTVPGPASPQKPSQGNVTNKQAEIRRAAPVRMSSAKIRSSTAVVPTTTVTVSTQKPENIGSANLNVKTTQSCGQSAIDEQDKRRVTPMDHHTTSRINACEEADTSAQHAGNQTFCFSSMEKSPDLQKESKPVLIKQPNQIEVKSGSALGQGKSLVQKTRTRCSSESSSSSSRPSKDKRKSLRVSNSFNCHLVQTKTRDTTSSSQKTREVQAENTSRSLRKISLVGESSKSAGGVSGDESKSRFRVQPSPRQTKAAPTASTPRTLTLSARLRQTPQSKLKGISGGQREDPSTGAASASSVKPKQNASHYPQTPTTSLMGTRATSASKLPRKNLGPFHGDQAKAVGNTGVSGGPVCKQTPFKSSLKTRLIPAPGKNIGQALTSACKPAAFTSKGAPNSTLTPLKRTAFGKLCLPSGGAVDKSKSKTASRQRPSEHHPSQPKQSNGPPDVVPSIITKGESTDQTIQHLKGLLKATNRKFEALSIVLQQTLTKHDESTKQRRELSTELVNLQGDLVSSIHSSERLEREKEELRVSLQEAVQKVQEQHQRDVAELKHTLEAFYQAEWDKIHLSYQKEADKCRTLMQQQIEELKASHEAMRVELQTSHEEQLQCVKQQHDMSMDEFRKVHAEELQALEKTLKDTETTLSGQIEELTTENNVITEKLNAEEKRKRELAEKSQKDSHTLYLEQELESLKVVLDIKNKQLHQQEKKLMEIDKLVEKNVKLDENLKRVQQENEDFRARMERHSALSRQLSTEQAVLQESLQESSKVNKRLSMENEELLWKLHNGDLNSSHKVSSTSTSPSHSFSLQSPRSSTFFSSSPVSPR